MVTEGVEGPSYIYYVSVSVTRVLNDGNEHDEEHVDGDQLLRTPSKSAAGFLKTRIVEQHKE